MTKHEALVSIAQTLLRINHDVISNREIFGAVIQSSNLIKTTAEEKLAAITELKRRYMLAAGFAQMADSNCGSRDDMGSLA